jgi:hypothetical protein
MTDGYGAFNWKLKYLEKSCPSATLLGLNLGCCSRKLVTNHLSYGTTYQDAKGQNPIISPNEIQIMK